MKEAKMDLQDARILIVDDTEANLDVLCELLEPEGYRVSMAPNGEVAIRIARRVLPDLILMDVMMPGINGFEACRRLKEDEKTREIPVIFITAENVTESVVAGFEVGGVDYITKPFQNEEVLVRVQTHLKIDHLTRELAKSNREIQEATERKSRFLASMSHELRTPLTAVKGYVDNLLDGIGGELNERQQHTLSRVTENADHLLDLVNDLLDLSKIEAGRMEVEVAAFDVAALIGSCCETVGSLVRPGVRLDKEISDRVGEARTDEAKLRMVLMNLLSNAVKFTEKGEIAVGAVQGDGELAISVCDTGPGIPANALGLIFDEFEQVKGTDKQHKGTGLGLSITKKLGELLGGTIWVESEVGKGSTFTVRIPAAYTGTKEGEA